LENILSTTINKRVPESILVVIVSNFLDNKSNILMWLHSYQWR